MTNVASPIIPSETSAEHLRNCLQVLALARYGQTATGQPARVLTDVEWSGIIRRLVHVTRQIESAGRT